MFVLNATILIIFKLALAWKDAMSFLTKSKKDEPNTKKWLEQWHAAGATLDLFSTLLLAWASNNWVEVPIQSFLIRLAMYDLSFNYLAKLDLHHIGTTAITDKFFSKIFGSKGAVKKSLVFASILILWGLIKWIF
jgi:hypothetical protein